MAANAQECMHFPAAFKRWRSLQRGQTERNSVTLSDGRRCKVCRLNMARYKDGSPEAPGVDLTVAHKHSRHVTTGIAMGIASRAAPGKVDEVMFFGCVTDRRTKHCTEPNAPHCPLQPVARESHSARREAAHHQTEVEVETHSRPGPANARDCTPHAQNSGSVKI